MKYFLPLTVFATGACVLILELLFMRILAPYFGNTIYTTSGTITIILLALSVGYKVGGQFADKFNSPVFFYSLIIFCGLTTAISHLAMGPLLPLLSNSLRLDTGPLIAGLIFMLIPNLLFGMLSPFAIKLQMTQLAKSGNVAGSMYFWSTLGSIAGSLLTTFYLIPFVGLDASLRAAYIAIFIIGSIGLLANKHLSKLLLATIPILIISTQAQSFVTDKSTINLDGIYEKILIRDITYQDRPARALIQNTNFSAAIYLDGPDLLFDYTKYAELIPTIVSHPSSALALGAGAYTIPKWLHQTYPELPIDVVEIEPSLEKISQKYFTLPQTAKIQSFIDDGRRFLQHTSNVYDIIFADMYSSRFEVPSHTTTKEFFALANAKTSAKGLLMINLIGNLSDPASAILPVIATMQNSFPHLLIFGVKTATEDIPQNVIIIASKQDLTPSGPIWDKFSSHQVQTSSLSLQKYPLLTDDKNPIDLLYAKSL